jgi:hypothetical protein
MSEEIAKAARNCIERFEREDETFYSTLDTFENYFINRARLEKNDGFTRILQELIFLRNLTRRSICRKATHRLVENISRRKRIISVASKIAAEQGSDEPTVEHRAMAEEQVDNGEDPEQYDPEIDRLKRSLDTETVSDMIDFENGAVKDRELSNYIEANFPDDGLLDSIATESLQTVITELDREYKNRLKEDLLEEMLDIAEGDEDIDETSRKLAEAIRSEQLKYHREARGWP